MIKQVKVGKKVDMDVVLFLVVIKVIQFLVLVFFFLVFIQFGLEVRDYIFISDNKVIKFDQGVILFLF